MTIPNSFALTLPVNILQLCVNIILWGVYKMLDIVVTFGFLLLVGLSILSYMLGYREGYTDAEVHAKLVAVRERSILQATQKHMEDFKETWKA